VQEYLSRNPGGISDIQLVATDISPAVLAEAKTAYYDTMAVTRGLPAEIKNRYFNKDKQHWEERWQLCDDIRKRVRFTQANRLASYSTLGRFDGIESRHTQAYGGYSGPRRVSVAGRFEGNHPVLGCV